MTAFPPLAWVAGTLTIFHFIIWVGLSVLGGFRKRENAKRRFDPFYFWFALVAYAIFYSTIALVFGQVFGGKFDFSQTWPTGMLFGLLLLSALVVVDAWSLAKPGDRAAKAIFLVLAGLLLSGFFVVALYVMPRLVGFGLIDFPQSSWGVPV